MLDALSPPHSSRPVAADPFTTRISAEGARHVLRVTGELDLASRDLMLGACVESDHRVVVVDLAELTFMDCAGYGALMTARRALEQRDGSLTLADALGEPLRLLTLIEATEKP